MANTPAGVGKPPTPVETMEVSSEAALVVDPQALAADGDDDVDRAVGHARRLWTPPARGDRDRPLRAGHRPRRRKQGRNRDRGHPQRERAHFPDSTHCNLPHRLARPAPDRSSHPARPLPRPCKPTARAPADIGGPRCTHATSSVHGRCPRWPRYANTKALPPPDIRASSQVFLNGGLQGQPDLSSDSRAALRVVMLGRLDDRGDQFGARWPRPAGASREDQPGRRGDGFQVFHGFDLLELAAERSLLCSLRMLTAWNCDASKGLRGAGFGDAGPAARSSAMACASFCANSGLCSASRATTSKIRRRVA